MNLYVSFKYIPCLGTNKRNKQNHFRRLQAAKEKRQSDLWSLD